MHRIPCSDKRENAKTHDPATNNNCNVVNVDGTDTAGLSDADTRYRPTLMVDDGTATKNVSREGRDLVTCNTKTVDRETTLCINLTKTGMEIMYDTEDASTESRKPPTMDSHFGMASVTVTEVADGSAAKNTKTKNTAVDCR